MSSCDFDLIQALARPHIEELRTSGQSWAALGFRDSLGQSGRQVTGSVQEAAPWCWQGRAPHRLDGRLEMESNYTVDYC